MGFILDIINLCMTDNNSKLGFVPTMCLLANCQFIHRGKQARPASNLLEHRKYPSDYDTKPNICLPFSLFLKSTIIISIQAVTKCELFI